MAEDQKGKRVTLERQATGRRVVSAEPGQSLYCDGFKGFAVHQGNVRLNLVEERYDPVSNEVGLHVIGRLILPMAAARRFADALGRAVSDAEKAITEGGSSSDPTIAPQETLN